MDPADLKSEIDRALKSLPDPRAPRTLLPRVMAAVEQQQARQPKRRTWFTWPLGWQVASVTALILLAAGLAWVLPSAQTAVSASTANAVASVHTRFAGVIEDASALTTAARIVWTAFFQPIVGCLLAFLVVMSVACAAFGAALGRVALGGV
jgi:hypothetical protein